MTGDAILRALADGARVAAPVALVAAHPDDETLGAGGRLILFDRLTLIHLTDGAPADPAHAVRAGFADPDAYAAARRAELDTALAALGARPVRRIAYRLADQGLADDLAGLADRLARDLAGQAAVLTHAYEGGHPDHDSAALAVARACERLGAAAPARLEFAGYHGRDGVLQPNRFHPDPARPQIEVALAVAARQAKAQAFAAFATQGDILANFPVGHERFRRAPDYDFAQPPPCGEALYDRYGWPLSSMSWRAAAAAAFEASVTAM